MLGEPQSPLKREGIAPGQIVLIGPAAKEKGSPADPDKAAGIPLTASIRNRWEDAGLW